MVTLKKGVMTSAILTVIVIISVPTAVAAIPATSTIIIFVVTVAVPSEMIHSTGAITILARILARTVFAILVSFVGATAVAIVPAALANVISVVAIFVAQPYFDASLVIPFENFAIFSRFFLITKALTAAAVTLKLGFECVACVVCYAVQLIAGVSKT